MLITHKERVKSTLENAISKGLETWNIDMKFEPEGVTLLKCENTTNTDIKD